jgi:hypothetical protein
MKKKVAEKALVTFEIASIEELYFLFSPLKENFFLYFQSLSKPLGLENRWNSTKSSPIHHRECR